MREYTEFEVKRMIDVIPVRVSVSRSQAAIAYMHLANVGINEFVNICIGEVSLAELRGAAPVIYAEVERWDCYVRDILPSDNVWCPVLSHDGYPVIGGRVDIHELQHGIDYLCHSVGVGVLSKHQS